MKLNRLVNEAIHIMAPYFELEIDLKLKRRFPKIGFNLPKTLAWRDGKIDYVLAGGGYNPLQNIILLPENTNEINGDMIHEVGHWFHRIINPEIFRRYGYLKQKTTPLKEEQSQMWAFQYVAESIGDYSTAIYLKGQDALLSPRFTLVRLANMDLNEAVQSKQELAEFSSQVFELSGKSSHIPLDVIKRLKEA